MIFRQTILSAIVLLLVVLWSGRAWAGPPFITDDPDPTDYKHWEVYLFSTYNHVDGGDFAQIPAVEINYGIIPDVQLHLIAPGALDREPGSAPHYGYGDTEIGVKYRFVHETDLLPEIGTFPLVEADTGERSRGLGNGQTQIFAPIWLQKTFGPDKKWTSFGGGGFWYNPGRDHRNYFRFGWELQHDLNDHLTLGGEVYHETPITDDGHGHTAFNLGGYYNFDEHRHLLFSFGRDIDGPIHFACYLAFQLTF
jgi:hypothetical protein